jgi:hypothetical protein
MNIADLFDNMYDLVDALTFLTVSGWYSYMTWLSEDITEMLPALDNFVSFGADTFKSRPEYRAMMVDIYTTTMNSEQLGENDRVNGCKLAESMMLNLRDHIDDVGPAHDTQRARFDFRNQVLTTFVGTAIAQTDVAETSALKLANLEVLINAVLYKPALALRLMESYRAGAARTFFDQWFSSIGSGESRLPRVHDKKLSIVALCALLELDPVDIPETLKEGWPGIVGGCLKLFQELPKAIEGMFDLLLLLT